MSSSHPAAPARRLAALKIINGPPVHDGAHPDGEVFNFGELARRLQVGGDMPARDRLPAAAGSVSIASAALMLGDAATYLAAWAALAPLAVDGATARLFALAAGIALALFWSESLYPGYRLHAHELLRRRATATLRVGVIACLGTGLLTGAWLPPLLMAAFLGLASLVQPLMRGLVGALARRAGAWGERAVILGAAPQTAELDGYFARNWQYGIRPEPDRARAGEPAPDIALIAGALPSSDVLARMRRRYSEVILLADLPGIRVSGLRPADLNGEIGLRIGTADSRRSAGTPRRLLDIAVAACAALAALPLLAVAAAAIYLVDPGPVIYRQAREGLLGRPFRILKLRTMYRDADQRLEALLTADPAARAEWAAHFKLRNDPRILPIVGDVLRATSIDELPQLFNVIAGDMRIVGPRPFPHYHLAAMDADFRAKRCSVLPGLTGLWQISERSAADIDRQQSLDEFYLDNRSFWLDAHILLSADDLLMPGALARAAAVFAAEPDLLMAYGRALHFVDDLAVEDVLSGNILVRALVEAHVDFYADGSAQGTTACSLDDLGNEAPTVLGTAEFYRLNKSANRVHACAAVTRTAAQKRLGGYLATLPHSGDYEMWLRFSAHGAVGHIPRFQVAARHHTRNMSTQYDYMSDVLQRALAVQELEATCGSLLPRGLLTELRAGIAAEALRATSAPLRQGSVDKRHGLVATAKTLDSRVTRRWIWGMYKIKVAVGPRIWSFLGKCAPPIVLKKWRT